MRILSWNVNGLRACVGKGFNESVIGRDPDIICLQEIKLSARPEGRIPSDEYAGYWNIAEKKGYSGTAILTRIEPERVSFGLAAPDPEGRVVTAEFEAFILVACYTPNAQRDLARLSERLVWEDDLRAYLAGLRERKPVVLCGDLNVAHMPIDLKHPKSNRGRAGYTDEEREKFNRLLDSGFADAFRRFYPDLTDQYTWWSYVTFGREKNVGWRIDYFCVSEDLMGRVADSRIRPEIMGSDHCPIELDLNL